MGLSSTGTSIRYSIGAILLALVFTLSACGGDEPEPITEAEPAAEVIDQTDDAVVEGDAEVEAEGEVDVEAEVDAEAEVETEAESDTTIQQVEVVTDTAIITATEVMTETDIITQTEVTEVITETRVIVEQEVTTDTDVAESAETVTDSDVMTDVTEIEGDSVDATPSEATDTEAMTGTESTSETSGAVTSVGFVDAQNWTMRASTLLDHNFTNQDGEVSGELEDLLIDTANGRILFASVEYGGFLDLGDKDIVVPMNALQWGTGDELILGFNEQELENFPDLGNDWPVLSDPAWDDDVNQFWGNVGIDANIDFQEASDSVIWASNLIGNSLADNIGAGAGNVEDILVDLASGQARYAIVQYDGDAEGQVLIPLGALTVQSDGDERMVMLNENLDVETIQSAPRITEGGFPADQPVESDTLYNDVDPFWADWDFF